MKKNIFNLFLNKLLEYPLWVKQVVYLRLFQNMRNNHCERYVITHSDKLFSTYVPTVTFVGKTEMWNKISGLDTNIYNFLNLCYEGYSILEISLNTFLSMEEVAKHCIFCIEQNYIEIPDSQEVFAMAGLLQENLRPGNITELTGLLQLTSLTMQLWSSAVLMTGWNINSLEKFLLTWDLLPRKMLKPFLY